jgi:hypothetical protein
MNLTTSVGTENYSMLTTVSTARSEPLLKWQSIIAVLLSCGTVRFTVEQYEIDPSRYPDLAVIATWCDTSAETKGRNDATRG